MFLIRSNFIMGICFALSSLCIVGSAVNSKNQLSETLEAALITSWLPISFEETDTTNTTSKENLDSIDYGQFLKKTWVLNEWNGEVYDTYSFIITDMANGNIKGILSTSAIIEPDFFIYRLEPVKWGNIFGTLTNGVAECQFIDSCGNKGNITLSFKKKQ